MNNYWNGNSLSQLWVVDGHNCLGKRDRESTLTCSDVRMSMLKDCSLYKVDTDIILVTTFLYAT